MELSNVTAVIKTFLRDEYMKDCVKSLRENWPDVKIIVGDGGNCSQEKREWVEKMGGKYVELPFDCGICVGRNTLVDLVETDYVLIGDDDFNYGPDAHLDIMLKLNEIADIVGGRVREKGVIRDYQGFFEHTGNQLIVRRMLMDSWENYKTFRYKKCDLTFNFFIANKKIFEKVRWDEQIKVAFEHSEFFLSVKEAGFKVIFTPHCIVDHKLLGLEKTLEYSQYRNRRSDKERFFHKRNFESCIDMSGFMDTL